MIRKAITVVWLMVAASAAWGQSPDIVKIVQDTQRFRQGDGQMDMIWWIPSEYWEVVFEKNPGMSPEKRASFIKIVDDYLVLSVLEGTIGPMGGITGTSKEELLRKMSVDINGHALKPLADAELTADARTFFQMMKPLLGNILGPMGQATEFIVLSGKDADGQKYANPRGNGLLMVHLADKEFQFRLPLGSFMPPQYDATTGEEFPGNYQYSPFTGKKLQPAAPGKP